MNGFWGLTFGLLNYFLLAESRPFLIINFGLLVQILSFIKEELGHTN